MMKYFILIFGLWLAAGCQPDNANQRELDRLAAEVNAERIDPILVVRSNLPFVDVDSMVTAVRAVPSISSLIVYQDSTIKAEWYRGSLNRNRTLNIKSASKSVLSTLIGIAIEQGHIESIDDPVAKYIPRYFENPSNPDKRNITVRHLLTMSSGLESTSFGNYGRWVASSNWVRFVVNSDLEATPGTRMRYSTGDTHILSAVLTEATGMSTRAFAERNLFTPMSIRVGGWDRSPEGYFFGGNNMALSPGGLLAYGQLYLNNGNHNGRQLVPAAWVEESLKTHFERTSFNLRGHNYGFKWWNNSFGAYHVNFAWGYGGQYVFVIEDLNAVVVITGNPDTRTGGVNDRIYTLMDYVVIPYLHHSDSTHRSLSTSPLNRENSIHSNLEI